MPVVRISSAETTGSKDVNLRPPCALSRPRNWEKSTNNWRGTYDLELDDLALKLDRSNLEVGTNCGNVRLSERVLCEPE